MYGPTDRHKYIQTDKKQRGERYTDIYAKRQIMKGRLKVKK